MKNPIIILALVLNLFCVGCKTDNIKPESKPYEGIKFQVTDCSGLGRQIALFLDKDSIRIKNIFDNQAIRLTNPKPNPLTDITSYLIPAQVITNQLGFNRTEILTVAGEVLLKQTVKTIPSGDEYIPNYQDVTYKMVVNLTIRFPDTTTKTCTMYGETIVRY
jgi:hypothetical protein